MVYVFKNGTPGVWKKNYSIQKFSCDKCYGIYRDRASLRVHKKNLHNAIWIRNKAKQQKSLALSAFNQQNAVQEGS